MLGFKEDFIFLAALGLDIEDQGWLDTVWAELGGAGNKDVFRSSWH